MKINFKKLFFVSIIILIVFNFLEIYIFPNFFLKIFPTIFYPYSFSGRIGFTVFSLLENHLKIIAFIFLIKNIMNFFLKNKIHNNKKNYKKSKKQLLQKNILNKYQYIFPTISLLEEKKITKNEEDCEKQLKYLIATLNEFNIKVSAFKIHKGPIITRYDLIPEKGIRIEKISNLKNNIALSLKALSIRILSPVPGENYIGIEVSNKIQNSIYLREIIESNEWINNKSKIPILIGKNIIGEPLIIDLADMPHMLIGGSTGSGKTVFLNTIIISLLYYSTPRNLRFVLIDPKIVEMNSYNTIPHMLMPVITDVQLVPEALQQLIKEMEKRYMIFSKMKVKNINEFNLLMDTKDPKLKLAYIVCIIDELADLMIVSSFKVETYISRLAQLARASGIHLIIATQRPSVNVVTGIIKANLSCRIAFKMASKIDSRIILDAGGADELIGKGDMLISNPKYLNLIRAQGVFTSNNEINKIIDFVSK